MSLMWYFIGFTLVFGTTLPTAIVALGYPPDLTPFLRNTGESVGGMIGSPATYPLLLNVPHDSCLPGQNIPALAYAYGTASICHPSLPDPSCLHAGPFR